MVANSSWERTPSSRSSFSFLRVSIWESRSGVAVAMGASAGALFSATGAGELAEAFCGLRPLARFTPNSMPPASPRPFSRMPSAIFCWAATFAAWSETPS